MSLIKDFWWITQRYNRGQWGRGLGMVLWYMAKSLPVHVLPIYIGIMVDLATNRPEGYLWWAGAWTGGMLLLVLQNILTHLQFMKTLSRITRTTGLYLRQLACRRLQELSLLFHKRAGVGKLQAKLVRDIDLIENQAKMVVEPLFGAAWLLVIAAMTMLWRAPWVMLVFAIAVPMAVAIQWYFRQRIRDHAANYRQSVEAMTHELSDMIDMVPMTRAHGLESQALERTEPKLEHVRHAGHGFDVISAWFAATSWVSVVCTQAVFLFVSVVAHHYGWLTVGDIVMFNTFFTTLTGSLVGLLGTITIQAQIRDAFSSVDEILDAEPIEENTGKPAPADLQGRFDLVGVRYAYPGCSEPALDGVDLSIEPGTTLAIVGPSGGGKSTLLSVMMGFLRPQRGQVCVDGVDTQELDLRGVRRFVGVVRQDSTLFSGTIRDNVAFGLENITDDRLRWALEQANAWGFVSELPQGPDTRVGQNGQALSGGQMQRLSVARALLRDPRVLILDEPTSALDPENEILVRQALERAIQGRTAIIVTHALLGVASADRIVVIERGHIVAAGTHRELMAQDNYYSRSRRAIEGLSGMHPSGGSTERPAWPAEPGQPLAQS